MQDQIARLFSHYARPRYCSPLIVSIGWLTRARGDGQLAYPCAKGAGCERTMDPLHSMTREVPNGKLLFRPLFVTVREQREHNPVLPFVR